MARKRVLLAGPTRVIPSWQGGPILPARVANQNREFALFSRITESLIKIKRGKMAPFFSSVIIFFISPCFVLYVILLLEKRVCTIDKGGNLLYDCIYL